MLSIFHLDIMVLVKTFGYIGILAIVFAESGVFLGFFLPGDSLLFTAGLLAGQGVLSIVFLALLVPVAAILGDNFGYWFGSKVGQKLYAREDSFFFHKHHIDKTKEFYAKYGAKAIVLARFVPIVRTFTPVLAGVGGMPYRVFMKFNILGAVLWSTGVLLLGFTLGSVIPDIDKYLLPIILLIVLASVVPIVYEMAKHQRAK